MWIHTKTSLCRHQSKGPGMSGDHNANQKPKSFLDFNILLYRPPIKKVRGARARRRALNRRVNAPFLKLLRSF